MILVRIGWKKVEVGKCGFILEKKPVGVDQSGWMWAKFREKWVRVDHSW